MDFPRKRENRAPRYALYAAGLSAILGGPAIALSRLREAPPTVDRATVWTDTVQRGTMIRSVHGQGVLAPHEARWISATTNARVEKVLVMPGAQLRANEVLFSLSNPELELAALEADRHVASAEASLTNLSALLESQRLAQESTIATLKASLENARGRAIADQDLASKGFLSKLERNQTQGAVAELEGRLAFEGRRLEAIRRATAAQLAAQRADIERLRSIAQYRHKLVDELTVRADGDGIIQESRVQVGQTVVQGALLAKLAKVERLKAELRVAETEIRDIAPGQKAVVDLRDGVVEGKVTRIDPVAVGGAVRVEVSFDVDLPKEARIDQTVDGTIEIECLKNVLYVGRPANGKANSQVQLFKLVGSGDEAVRTVAQLGHTSVRFAEITNGLSEGDRVILSDTSQRDNVDRIRLR